MIKIISSSIMLVLITIAVTFLVINLQNNDTKRLQNGSEKLNEKTIPAKIEEKIDDIEFLAEEELYLDIVATLEPSLKAEIVESALEIDDFDINLYFKGNEKISRWNR